MTAMTSNRARVSAAAVFALVLSSFQPGFEGGVLPRAQAQNTPPPVDVAEPVVKPVVEWDEYTGRFEAVDRVEIRARVSGYMQSVHFRDGQMVEAGDLLFIIDPRPFEAELARLQADLERAKTEVDLALRRLERGERLIQTRAIPEEELDIRRSDVARTRAEVQATEALIRRAELDIEFTQVRTPIAGRISNRRVDVGNLISGGTEQSTLLTTVITLDPIYFEFDISEADHLRYVRLSRSGERESSRETANPVFVRLMDESEWTRKGEMNFVDNELSRASGTMRGRALFANPDLVLAPGMFGRMRLIGAAEREAMLLPDEAILADQSRKLVLTVDGEDTVVPKFVELGPVIDGLRVIRTGLEPGDRVIVNGLVRARPGAKVTPVPVEIAPSGQAGAAEGASGS